MLKNTKMAFFIIYLFKIALICKNVIEYESHTLLIPKKVFHRIGF